MNRPVVLTRGQKFPHRMAIDAANVYFSNDDSMAGAVMGISKTGGTPFVVANGLPRPGDIALDGTYAYWTNAGMTSVCDAGVMKSPLSGGTPKTLASNQSAPAGIAVDDSSVYWVDAARGLVMQAPK